MEVANPDVDTSNQIIGSSDTLDKNLCSESNPDQNTDSPLRVDCDNLTLESVEDLTETIEGTIVDEMVLSDSSQITRDSGLASSQTLDNIESNFNEEVEDDNDVSSGNLRINFSLLRDLSLKIIGQYRPKKSVF